jgi:mRNA interferase MazF
MEQAKEFDTWNAYKKQLDSGGVIAYFRAREVWWCSIGVNVGREQDGHHERFERPVLVLRRFSNELFWGVPISTKIKPDNRYYFAFDQGGVTYSAITSQLRIFDARRLARKLYTMQNQDFAEIKLALIREIAFSQN